jgi:hypothetical protein
MILFLVSFFILQHAMSCKFLCCPSCPRVADPDSHESRIILVETEHDELNKNILESNTSKIQYAFQVLVKLKMLATK